MLSFFQGRNETPRLRTLRQLALFSTLSRLELRVVDALLHERRFLKGEIIFDEGEEGQALYLVMSVPLGYLSRYLEKRWAAK